MAKASGDPGKTDLEQKILQVLRDAGSPVKVVQLAKECQESKKTINQVLYRMKGESQVALVGPATWQLVKPGTGGSVSAELALPSNERPRQVTAVALQKPGSQLSDRQEKIYQFLEANGPTKSLIIAQSLGLKKAKDVNPDLYALRDKHLLSLDQNSMAWAIYQPEDSGEGHRRKTTNIIYQQNPINMICQNGPNSHISIESSEAVQIGHGNSIVRQTTMEGNSSMAPICFPPLAPADSSTQDPLAGPWGPQDIHLEKSVLRRVQLGHSNEMSLQDAPATDPGHGPSSSSFSVSPPVSATTADPEALFEIRMPTPGPQAEADGDVTQRVLIKACFLEDATIGHRNRMQVALGAAGPGGGAGPQDSSWDGGQPAGEAAAEPAGDTAPPSEAAEPSGEVPHEGREADPDMDSVTAHLEAMTLGSRAPGATEDGPSVA